MNTPNWLSNKCIPVERRGKYFVLAEDWLKAGLDFPEVADLEQTLRKRVKKSAKVRFRDRQLSAQIFLADSEDEVSYAIINAAVKTVETQATVGAQTGRHLDIYLGELLAQCSFSEYILPEQRSYLESDFVQPHLSRLHETSRSKFSWSQLNNWNRLIVVGSAGAGKTTLLRRLVLDQIKGYGESASPLPIYVMLRSWDGNTELTTHIKRGLADLQGAWIAENFEGLAASGNLSILLDGLDEVSSENRSTALNHLRHLTETYSDCRFTISTRWGTVPNDFDDFTCLVVEPFSNIQIKEVVYHKLYRRTSWKSFWTRLIAEPALFSVVGNPLLLTLLLSRYLRSELRPSFFSEVFEASAHVLVDEWDAVRGVVRSKSAELSPRRKEMCLQIVANHVSEVGAVSFSTADVTAQLAQVMPATAPAEILQLISETTSLIQKRSDGKWEFSHKVFQEFFQVSHWVGKLLNPVNLIRDLLSRDSTSELVNKLRFSLGLSNDASDGIANILSVLRPDQSEFAAILSEVFSQRLVVDPSVVLAFVSYLRRNLADALAEADELQVDSDHPTDGLVRWSLVAKRKDDEEAREWARSLTALLEALRKARDGSASSALVTALQADNNPALSCIARLLVVEGAIESRTDTTSDSQLLVIFRIVIESPEIGES